MTDWNRQYEALREILQPYADQRNADAETIARLTAEVERLKHRALDVEAALAVLNEGKSPCGHWSAHAMTNDGGKTISCLECALAAANERIAACSAGVRHCALGPAAPAEESKEEPCSPQKL